MDEFNFNRVLLLRKKGFSMLELMFSLVAISVFLAAFAPVISSKFAAENEMVFNKGELITSEECDINFPCNLKKPDGKPYLECTLCYGEEACVTCGGECPAGTKKNKSKCRCE